MPDYEIRARVTGVLVEEERLLLVKHKLPIADNRCWSLPGGKVEQGETLEQAILREMQEETGLHVRIDRLLYVCDKPEEAVSRIHFLFLLTKESGVLRLPTNEFDDNAIEAVEMIPVGQLTEPDYNFTPLFAELVHKGFPGAGHYKGHKSNIGL